MRGKLKREKEFKLSVRPPGKATMGWAIYLSDGFRFGWYPTKPAARKDAQQHEIKLTN